jgi:hypothetical protein
MLTYVFHVQRKDGECDTGLDFYRGDMPRAGEIVQVVVRGKTYGNSIGGIRLNFWLDKYSSALSASRRASRSPAFADLTMCFAMIVRPASAYSSLP